jgi:opacity protein-like surface antigen
MKKMTLTVMAIAGLSEVSMAFADTSDIKASNNQVGIQAILTNVDYTETGNGQLGSPTGILDTETGRVPGYALSISTMQNLWLGNDYIEAGYDYSSGTTNYVGGALGPPPTPYGSLVGISSAVIKNYRVRYGTGIIVNDGFMLTPYVEFGSHIWERGVNWGETYTHDYYGIGALGQYSPASRLVLSVDAMFGNTFGSNIDIVGAFSGALGNSSLYRIGAGADYAFEQNLHANIGVDYMRFNYGISAVYPVSGGYVLEPDSSTNYTTVRIGLGYAF